MKFLFPTCFTKGESALPCHICQLSQKELAMILSFQDTLYQSIEDKNTFVTLSQDEWLFLLNHGFALGVFPDEHPTLPAYIIGCLYPSKEENLGTDIGLSEQELLQVAHLEIAMADPSFRGWGMHSRLCQLCTEHLAQDGHTRFVMSTVHPQNLPSRRALESAGLQSVLEKEKYGGKPRCIMLKKLY